MPLREGSSRAVISENIAALRREGKALNQAIAIALSKAREFDASGGRSSGLLLVIRRGSQVIGWTKHEGRVRSPERIVRGLLQAAAEDYANGRPEQLRRLAGARVSVEKGGEVRAIYEIRFAGSQLTATLVEGR